MPKRYTRYDDSYAFRIYDLLLEGKSEADICKVLGIASYTLASWKKKRPTIKEAFARVQSRLSKADTPHQTFRDFVYGRLPERLKDVWDELCLLEDEKSPIERIEKYLQKQGKIARQHLFLFAWIDSVFNASAALRKVNIGKATLDHWIKTDPDFADLFDEIEWHKKNFVEGNLMMLIGGGDSAATIFASRTLNADRGYGEKLKTESDVNVVNHNLIHIDTLALSVEEKRNLLQQIRALEKGKTKALENGINRTPIPVQSRTLPVRNR